MTGPDAARLVAWGDELRRVHARLRKALLVTGDALVDGETATTTANDLLVYCHGFCVALERHHRGEDRSLFPAIEAAHPHLAPVLRSLERDHTMIAHLLGGLRDAIDHGAPAAELAGHLEGIAAIMENHFRFEERQLVAVLQQLAFDAEPSAVLGTI